ncbi:MAG TPA: hypothetical protein PKA43_05650, partial [Candidatus Competibacter phosphatis]|nr:hypothetical protein [Candidatus Competibacter phosphatis]HMR02837.1 hypothetical protein [Candidatus Competibacter phosphatis]
DPSPAVARQLRRRLETGDLLTGEPAPGDVRYFTSGPPEPTAEVMTRLLGHSIALELLPESIRHDRPALHDLETDLSRLVAGNT